MTKTQAVVAKKALITQYLELAKSKCGLEFSTKEELAQITKKPSLVLQSNIAKLSKLADYDAAPVFTVTVPAPVITPDTTTHGSGGLTGSGDGRKRASGISEAQLKYFISLFKEKHGIDLEDAKNVIVLEGAKQLTKFQAMREIDTLKALPTIQLVTPINAPAPVAAGTAGIKDGIYAVQDGVTKCYQISNGKAGTKWAGFIFLDRVSSDDRYPIKNRDEKARILTAIREDIEAAGILAAHTLKQCRNPRCKRTLSDTENNPYYPIGYGPKCGANDGAMD